MYWWGARKTTLPFKSQSAWQKDRYLFFWPFTESETDHGAEVYSVVRHILSLCKALGWIPSTKRREIVKEITESSSIGSR